MEKDLIKSQYEEQDSQYTFPYHFLVENYKEQIIKPFKVNYWLYDYMRLLNYLKGTQTTRHQLEKSYIRQWNKQFKWRLKAGHFIALLFRKDKIAAMMLHLLKKFPSLLPIIIKQTHGKPIDN